MAKAYVKELEDLHAGQAFPIPVWNEPNSVGDQATPIDFTAGHQESAAFGASTKFIVVSTDAISSYLVSTPGTPATTNNFRLPVGTVVMAVRPGDKISFVSNT